MTTPVHASHSLLESLLSRKLVMVTGKGGIGKTLSAATIALAAAARGKQVLLCESSASDQIAPLFGKPVVGHVETQIAPNLTCINLNAAGNFREYITKYLGQKVLFDTVFSHRVVKSFFNTVPGLAETMLLGRLYYTLKLAAQPPDFVVFDGAASGHFLSLMTTPDAVIASGLAGPLVKETQRVRDFLADKTQCALVVVAVPEELVVAETLDFVPRLKREAPVDLLGVIVNRMPPAMPDSSADHTENSAAYDYLVNRWRMCREARVVLQERLSPYNLEFLDFPELGFVDEPLTMDFWRSMLKGGSI